MTTTTPAAAPPSVTDLPKYFGGRETLYPSQEEPSQQEDLKSVLDRTPIHKSVKADVWDAFHEAESPEDFVAKFDHLPLPDDTKADLFDLKFGAGGIPDSGTVPFVPNTLDGTQSPPAPVRQTAPIVPVQPSARRISDFASISRSMAANPPPVPVPRLPNGLPAPEPLPNPQLKQPGVRTLSDYARTAPAGGFPVGLPPGMPSPGLAPQDFKRNAPHRGLEYQPQQQQYVSDPRTGEQRPVTPFGESALDFLYTAGKHTLNGVAALAEPLQAGAADQAQMLRSRAEAARTGQFNIPPTTQTSEMRRSAARGASEILHGAFDAATPMILASGVVAPVGTVISLVAAGLSEELVTRVLKSLDTPEEYSELAGLLAGLAGAHVGAMFSYVKNAAFRRMVKSLLQTRLNNEFRAQQEQAHAERMAHEAATSGAAPGPTYEAPAPPPAEPAAEEPAPEPATEPESAPPEPEPVTQTARGPEVQPQQETTTPAPEDDSEAQPEQPTGQTTTALTTTPRKPAEKPPPEKFPVGVGWKLHLNVPGSMRDPLTAEISRFLKANGIPHKVGYSGDQQGKGLTIYAGSKDAATAVAHVLNQKFGTRLGRAAGDVLKDDIPFAGKIWGRFDTNDRLGAFHQYGGRGIPYTLDDMSSFAFGGDVTPEQAHARADSLLKERYGEFYTGTAEGAKPKSEPPPKVPAHIADFIRKVQNILEAAVRSGVIKETDLDAAIEGVLSAIPHNATPEQLAKVLAHLQASIAKGEKQETERAKARNEQRQRWQEAGKAARESREAEQKKKAEEQAQQERVERLKKEAADLAEKTRKEAEQKQAEKEQKEEKERTERRERKAAEQKKAEEEQAAEKAEKPEPPKGPTIETDKEAKADATEETERPAEPRVETGGAGEQPGDEDSEALGGAPAENVRGAGKPKSSVPVGDDGGETDVGPDGPTVEAGAGTGQNTGNSTSGVGSASGRKGSAQPDLRSSDAPSGSLDADFRLTVEEALAIENNGAKTKARANLEAIRIAKQLFLENRSATLEEQRKMAQYVGWGASELANGIFKYDRAWAGIREELENLLTDEEWKAAERSTINAHYTRRDVAAAMWDALERMGFRAGSSVIEPGMGIGNFFMMMPEHLNPGTRRTGIEMDLLTGSMAKALFPGSNIVIKPFQETNLPDGYFDAAIGNVPFQGGINIYDPQFARQPFLTNGLHNYFFAKTLTKLRPGGVMFLITSRGTMDSVEAKPFRKWMAQNAVLLGAVRLPRDTFKANAGTEVTVDLIALRKRVPGDPLYADGAHPNPWIESNPHEMENGGTVNINEYYHAHPEMMMGKMNPGKMYHAGYPELHGEFSLDRLKEILATLPSDVIPSWTTQPSKGDNLVENYPDAAFVKDGQMAFVNGVLVRRNGSYLEPVTLTGIRLSRARGLIAIRGTAREVIRSQQLDFGEQAIVEARNTLNQVYDAFVKLHGPVNSNANAFVMSGDPDWPLLSSLEDWDKKRKVATKRDIFSVRTIQKPQRVESVETGPEALAVSLNDFGRIDWDRMQSLTGKTPEELRKELEGKIYQNPITKAWETADEYLSGNVRKKLAAAEFAAESDPRYQANAEALKGVVPRDLLPGEIDAFIGATWVPGKVYEQFAKEVLKSENVSVKLVPLTGGFAVNENYHFSDKGVANKIELGTPYFSGMELFQMALNGNSPIARDEYTDFDGTKRSVKNPAETIKAVEKLRRLQDEFSQWLWTDPGRAAVMSRKYNDERNNLKLREFNGSHLTFPGLNRSWLRNNDLDAHQRNVVWRIIQSGNSLLAHAVGAGKTLEMITAVMELKRLGLARKPMIVVPNHLVSQWKDDFLRAYPGAQILVPTKKDFEKNNRRKLMSKIATGNYDAVVVGHKSFELLPVKDETFKEFMDEQIEEIENALAAMREGKSSNEQYKDPSIKQLVRRKAQLEERLKKRTARAGKDQTVAFEELGVDWLFVDEAHAYKNLGYMTMMDRVAGLPNSDANRAVDMLLKTSYIRKLHGTNRGVVFASGTPVSNSIAETWTMMRYLMPDYLRNEGMDQFDAWAKTFGKTTTNMEVAPEGGRMIARTRFAEFVNAPELMNMFRLVADIRTKEQLNLPTPAIHGGGSEDVVVPASRALKAYIAGIGERADAIRSGAIKDPSIDNMLKISSDARKASLDMRLVDPMAREDPGSKVNAAIKNIIRLYKEFDQHKATQLVFLDLSTPKAERGAKGRKKAEDEIANQGTDTPAPEPAAEEQPEAPPPADDEEDLDLYGDKEEKEPETVETAEEAAERFTVYNQIRRKLVAAGIPNEEIAFIHDANSDDRKKQLFDDMASGAVRVLIGSTEKMGAGMNVQKRLIALHHLDAPWRPSDVEQREGRIDRQGNMLWDEHQIPVHIFRYMTEGSFDAFMWQTIVAKARPITLLMNGDPSVRRIEEMGPVVASYEQAMALSSGNPLIKEKIILDQEIQKLEILRGGWLTEQATINQALGTLPAETKRAHDNITALTNDIATRDGDLTLKVGGKTFSAQEIRKEGADALIKALDKVGTIDKITPIDATYRGFKLQASPASETFPTKKSKDGNHFYIRQHTVTGKALYLEVRPPDDYPAHAVAQRQELAPRELSAADALKIHTAWENPKDDSLAYAARNIGYYTRPNLRLMGESGSYAVHANYETPSGTISSADSSIRGWEEDLINVKANLARLEKQKVELDSKKGKPFRDEQKLREKQVRQAELASILGENKDDVQAVGEEDDANDPLAALLKDPTSAMDPRWFPKQQIYVTSPSGEKESEKVHSINRWLGLQEVKRKNNDSRWTVIHQPTGTAIATFDDGVEAVAFARQAEKAKNWDYTTEKDRYETVQWAREFRRDQFKPPQETPAESRERLVPKPLNAEEEARQAAGPMDNYTPRNQKLKVPEVTKGSKGWAQADINGTIYSSDGLYLIAADIKPVAKADPLPTASVERLLNGTGNETPVAPVAFSTIGTGAKATRLIWFSRDSPMDARHYDDVLKRYPDAVFLRDKNAPRKILINDVHGKRVGLALTFRGAPAPPPEVGKLFDDIK